MNRRITPMLLALNALLAIGLVLLWTGLASSNHWEPPAAQRPNLDDSRAALLRIHPDAAATFAQIVDRPLFSSTRRPPPPPAPAAAASAPVAPPIELDKIKMFGTINGPGLRGVLAEVEGKSRFVRSGEQIGEWTLRRIRSNEAVFEKDDEERVIPLPLASGAAPAATGANASAGAKGNTGANPASRTGSPARANAPRPVGPSMSQLPGMLPQAQPQPRPAAPPPSASPADDASSGDAPPAVRGSWGP